MIRDHQKFNDDRMRRNAKDFLFIVLVIILFWKFVL